MNLRPQDQLRGQDLAFPGRYRVFCVLLKTFVLVGFGAILIQAVSLQVWHHEFWLGKARLQSETTIRIPVYRGSIYDRNGRLVAASVHQFSVFVDPSKVVDQKELARQLGPLIEQSTDFIEQQLNSRHGFTWLKRGISDQQRSRIEAQHLAGVQLSREYQRYYPYGPLAGPLLGFTGVDGDGLEGVEKLYDSLLEKTSLDFSQIRDGVRRRISLHDSNSVLPEQRSGLYLSLDAHLQFLAERELARAVESQGARAAEAVVLDPSTMEVLAMANWPPFDPNRYQQAGPGEWRNRAITDLFEPGSTFKIFLFAAALDQGIVRETDRIYCENGVYRLAGHAIHDVHAHGWLTVPDMLKVSSNIGASKLAIQLGAEKFHRYIRLFGFGRKSGIGLTGESEGLVRPWTDWQPIDLAASGFGQSIGVTALQLTSAVATVANGGIWKRPTILKAVVLDAGHPEVRRPIQPSKRVLSPATATLMTEMLARVTGPGGTGFRAVPTGYAVAGKTGTAQVIDPATGRYSEDRYTAIFTGFVPVEKPRLVITVVVHDPSKSIFGGTVAGPVFRNIAGRALPYLGVAPNEKDRNERSGPIRWARLDGTNHAPNE